MKQFMPFVDRFMKDCEQHITSTTTNKGIIVIAVEDLNPNDPNGEINIAHCILGGQQTILSALSGIFDDDKDNITKTILMAVARKNIDIYDISEEEDHED